MIFTINKPRSENTKRPHVCWWKQHLKWEEIRECIITTPEVAGFGSCIPALTKITRQSKITNKKKKGKIWIVKSPKFRHYHLSPAKAIAHPREIQLVR